MLSALSKLLAFAQHGAQVSKEPVVCDQVVPLETAFDATRYMGKWYEIMHTANQDF